MKYLLLLILLFGIQNFCFAQESCDCTINYKFVYQELLKSKSYKKVNKKIKGIIDSTYNQTLVQITQNSENSLFECFSKTAQIVMMVNDNHNTFEMQSFPIEMASWEDKELMTRFEESPEYKLFPFYKKNIDSLYNLSLNKNINEIEGIYEYGNHTKLILVNESGFINGYIYQTALKPWRKGELMLRLLPQNQPKDRYKLIFGNPINKKLIYNFEKFQNGFLMQLKIKKINVTHPAYHQEIYQDNTYLLKQLNDTVQYLKIGSFKSSNEGIQKAKSFCDSVKNEIKSKTLIVDLRGNTGGYKSNSKHFDNLLKKFNGRLVFLINFRTKSYAEIFAIQWKGKPNVTIAGTNTAGVIAYGRNYPKKQVSNDGCFLTHFTDMGGLLYIKYENSGVEPDVNLDFTINWVEQIIKSPNR